MLALVVYPMDHCRLSAGPPGVSAGRDHSDPFQGALPEQPLPVFAIVHLNAIRGYTSSLFNASPLVASQIEHIIDNPENHFPTGLGSLVREYTGPLEDSTAS